MSFSIRALLGLALATLLASPGLAATAEQLVAAEGPEIVRDASDLVDVVSAQPHCRVAPDGFVVHGFSVG